MAMITDEQIRALRDEAAAAGDTMQVEICETALGEDDFVSLVDGRHLSTRECRLECKRAIGSANANRDSAADRLISLSARENRTVVEYPADRTEYDAIVDGLRTECGDDCEGEERRGVIRYWGTTESGNDWSVEVARPEAG